MSLCQTNSPVVTAKKLLACASMAIVCSIGLFAQDDQGKNIGSALQDPANPIAQLFQGERLDLWSLQPIQDHSIEAQSAQAFKHPIDLLLANGSPTHNAQGSLQASKDRLLQRLSLDLIGLRASFEQVASFLDDQSPDAIEKQIDKLLGDPRFGEHWARLWLDTVRYSDSNGFDWDEYRKEAWRYRDFVIRAFNEDLPYDQFVLWQLAGDELLEDSPQTSTQIDQLIATGYLRLGPFDNAAKLFNEQDRARSEVLTDLTETTGAAFLGLTLSCCRCHHHKTDPLSQEDHYRFRAFFAATAFDESTSIGLEPQQRLIEEHNQKIDRMIEPIQASIDAMDRETKEKANADASEKIKDLKKQIEQLRTQKRTKLTGLLACDDTKHIDTICVLEQGNHQKPLEEVQPGFPSVLFPNPPEIQTPNGGKSTGRRLALAKWIVGQQNPWAARVIVNRVWQNLFGQGLVATPNDFGITGSAPLSRELLDHLAVYLVKKDWSIKSLIRYILSSHAYRAEIGSWRKLRRLSAEQMRDVVLQVTGQLQHRNGGPPVWPPVSEDVLQANPAVLDDNETKTKGWYPSPENELTVRSVYLIQKRTVRIPWLETFELPENTVSCARRDVSIVSSQALALLNADWVWEAAKQSTRIADSDGLFQALLSREPTHQEQSMCRSYLDEGRTLQELALVLLNSNELAFIP
ncbi:MAG: DUF1549 and DUF1553 domain-containing protein [Planctomycetota bacterium]